MDLSLKNISDQSHERVDKILEVIISFARLDFSKKTDVLGNNDVLDAICGGVNMLGEELEVSTISLREKEQLIKEIHHRVKNNLQIVSSLLNLQCENISDVRFLNLIKDSRNRINSMAIVHEMLYSSKDLSKIAIHDYVLRLSNSIRDSYSKPESNIEIKIKINQKIYFNIDQMIAIGLILNEIISNCFKHAFKNNNGLITIALKETESGYQLTIKDNGIGFPKEFDVNKHANLGIQLILMLSEQLDALVKIKPRLGAFYHITFPK